MCKVVMSSDLPDGYVRGKLLEIPATVSEFSTAVRLMAEVLLMKVGILKSQLAEMVVTESMELMITKNII
ncbi:unnamed protein product [Umbelopsis ramanniana]